MIISEFSNATNSAFLEVDGGGGGWRDTLNIVKFARKLVNSQPCCRRVCHSIFRDLLVFIKNRWSIGQTPLRQWKVSRHIAGYNILFLVHQSKPPPPFIANFTFILGFFFCRSVLRVCATLGGTYLQHILRQCQRLAL